MKTLIALALLLATGCRVVETTIVAYPGSTVIVTQSQQADKPIDVKGGGVSIPLVP